MKRAPSLYNADWFVQNTNTMAEIKGRWVLARPLGLIGRFWLLRFRLAWGVFRGKYDVLSWTDQ